MIAYDPSQPLIGLHVPKTAGNSIRSILENWYPGRKLLLHYRQGDELPVKHELQGGLCVYGHFNACRKFGVLDYYPEVRQFFCFLREPYARFVSQWLYLNPNGEKHDRIAFERWLALRAEEQLAGINTYSFVWHFPALPTATSIDSMFDEMFVFIGIFERLQQSVDSLALALQKETTNISHINISERVAADFETFRPIFEKHFVDELQIYEVALAANAEMTRMLTSVRI